ncbi:hypothetical protein [Streptosporangium sp. 'caverna']|uniref:hypothetical protein n=1 Tax=Streptosporangium sp. 'caverna' TaxID=2202249 RepID=UPI000D7E0C07|nr:hypothetical protein [Streptosporangium sp. 'caverna']AWS46879.1 hypothetical protein DKM19_41875 [Streptosporangium sp. 'caverna']
MSPPRSRCCAAAPYEHGEATRLAAAHPPSPDHPTPPSRPPAKQPAQVPDAVTTLKPLTALDFPAAFAVVDRAYTDQQPAHFAQPARELGYRLALDYKVDQRGVQGSAHGALLIAGSLACPLMPAKLARATTGLDDAAIRTPSEELTALIAAREPYLPRLKQSANADGAIRSTARRSRAGAGHHPSHNPHFRSPCRSTQPEAGIAMASDANSDLHQRPDTTRAFPDTCSAAPKPGRPRFGTP